MDALKRAEAKAWAIALMGVAIVVKLILAALLPLGVDEAYQVAVARPVSLSYFDHPPLSFWAMAASASVLGESVLAYRLPFVAMGAVTGWMLYLMADRIGGARAGLATVVLYLAAPHMFFGSGLFVLPDGALNMAGAIAAWAFVRMAGQARPALWLWALAGVAVAAGFASKYQSALIPFSVFVFMAVWPGRGAWLRQPGFWLAVGLAALGAVPVLAWNMAHDWASFAFHGARTERSLQLTNFAVMGVGQAIYMLPVSFVLALWAVGRGLRARLPEDRMLAWLAALPLAVFNGIFLFSDASFPHWTMPGFLFALPLAGAALTRLGRGWTIGWAVSGAVIWAAIALVVLQATVVLFAPPGPQPGPGPVAKGYHDWDDTTDFFDWSGVGLHLAERGDLAGVAVIAVPNWIEGGQIGAALPGWPVRVMPGGIPHHFGLMPGAQIGGRALYLHPDRLDRVHVTGASALARLRQIDPNAKLLSPVVLPRGGRPYGAVAVIALTVPRPAGP